MTRANRILVASAFAMTTLLPAQALAARTVIVSKNTTVIGNNVVIKSSGGTTTVTASNSCSTGISGYLYQSVLVLFGGGVVYNATQTNTCP
jgi:hypothetical protein